MKRRPFLLLFATLAFWGCGGPAPGRPSGESHDGATRSPDDQEASISVTMWTDDVELFMEHPLLRAGREAKFAVHLTELDDFRPVAEGPVRFRFLKAGAAPKTVTVEVPRVPGIFGPSLTFEEPGDYMLHLEILSDQIKTKLQYGPIEVLGEADPASEPEEPPAGQTISYLKEQQWKLPFASAAARLESIHETIRVPAEVKPKTGMESVATPASAGRYLPPGQGVPILGAHVGKGDLLGYIEPPPAERSNLLNSQVDAGVSLSRLSRDAAEAEAAVSQERSRLRLVEKEAARVERLVDAEALPMRRLDEIRSELEIRRASLQAAQKALVAFQKAISRYESTEKTLVSLEDRLPLRASVSGQIMEIHAVPGQQVESGEILFRIVDLSRVWVEGKVFENDLPRLDNLLGGTLLIAGLANRALPPASLILVGSTVHPTTRTLSVVFEVENRDRRIKLGARGQLGLVTSRAVEALAVPKDAVLLEENRSVVYVQLGGETFERRLVKTGIEDRDHIQILDGLTQGERIVTVGAYDVALAARSTEVPEHGHVH